MSRVMRAIAVLRGADPRARSTAAPPPTPAVEPTLTPDSTALAVALIACLDLLEPDEDAAERATAALTEAGVVPIDTVGARFDRKRHRAQGRIDTADPAQDWIIANSVRTGWARGETILRPAEVWVYRLTAEDAVAHGAGPA